MAIHFKTCDFFDQPRDFSITGNLKKKNLTKEIRVLNEAKIPRVSLSTWKVLFKLAQIHHHSSNGLKHSWNWSQHAFSEKALKRILLQLQPLNTDDKAPDRQKIIIIININKNPILEENMNFDGYWKWHLQRPHWQRPHFGDGNKVH